MTLIWVFQYLSQVDISDECRPTFGWRGTEEIKDPWERRNRRTFHLFPHQHGIFSSNLEPEKVVFWYINEQSPKWSALPSSTPYLISVNTRKDLERMSSLCFSFLFLLLFCFVSWIWGQEQNRRSRVEAVSLKITIILEKLQFLWIYEIWGNFLKNWYFANNFLIIFFHKCYSYTVIVIILSTDFPS